MNLSLYIHIPFCVRKCLYCDFNSYSGYTVTHDEYVAAVIAEMEYRARQLPEPPSTETLYFGGGTPSLLRPQLVERLIAVARLQFNLAPDAEITLEANPGTITPETLAGYRAAGVNRLSIGVQSLDDAMLTKLGRVHTAEQARVAFFSARVAGFENIGIDLIHSLPGQSLEHWRNTLEEALSLGPDHISGYGLTIEEGTPLVGMVDRNEIEIPGSDQSAEMYEDSISLLVASGYEHYEIANFARPGMRSRHNQVYWRRGSYLGFGAGAHSFLRGPEFGTRCSNHGGIESYCGSIPDGTDPVTLIHLSRQDSMEEFFFLGLRMLDGVDTDVFMGEFGISPEAVFPGVIDRQVASGLLQKQETRLSLTAKGVLLANQVFSAFV